MTTTQEKSTRTVRQMPLQDVHEASPIGTQPPGRRRFGLVAVLVAVALMAAVIVGILANGEQSGNPQAATTTAVEALTPEQRAERWSTGTDSWVVPLLQAERLSHSTDSWVAPLLQAERLSHSTDSWVAPLLREQAPAVTFWADVALRSTQR